MKHYKRKNHALLKILLLAVIILTCAPYATTRSTAQAVQQPATRSRIHNSARTASLAQSGSQPRAEAQSQAFIVPEKVRIGLYSNSPFTANPPSDSYKMICDAGVVTGHKDSTGNFVELTSLRLTGKSSPLNISKFWFDSEYAAATGMDVSTLADLVWRSEELRMKGYDPVLAHIGSWVLLVGGFGGKADSQQIIDAELSRAFPNWAFEPVSLTGTHIKVMTGNDRQYIYDTVSGNFSVKPALPSVGSVSEAVIDLNGTKYRGTIEFSRAENSDMSAINELALDEYLFGVVPHELQASSAPEALKAQAVTARTYTVNNLRRHSDFGFDMCATVHCQAYGGASAEDDRTNKAVADTVGDLVLYEGKPAQVFYSASSGGHTEDVRNVWGSTEYPYLCGVEDNYESGDSPHYNWEAEFSAADIREALSKSGTDIGDIKRVAVTDTSPFGRAVEVTVTGTAGRRVLKKDECRTFISGLYSTMYTIFGRGDGSMASFGSVVDGGGNVVDNVTVGEKTAVASGGGTKRLNGSGGAAISGSDMESFSASGTVFRFVGQGWGHGVGMSQEGAKGMALAGFSYVEILSHYFPGCKID